MFLYEDILYLTAVVLIFFLISLLYKHKDVSHIFSDRVLEKLSVSHQTLSSVTQYRLFLLVTLLLIFALSRPVIKDERVNKEQTLTPLIIALDVSKSMREKDIYPDRLTLARQKLNYLIEQSTHMNVGVILFTKDAYSVYPMSDDMKVLSYMIEHLDFEKNLGVGSNIFGALEASISMLKNSESKNILLLSDGGNSPDMQREASFLKEHKAKVFAIDISSVGSASLKDMIKSSGGYYEKFSLGSSDIRTIIGTIEQESLKEDSREYRTSHYRELFIYPLSLALLLLFFVFNGSFKFKGALKSSLLPMLIGLSFSQISAEAGLLDFYYLNKANSLYQDKKYQEAAEVYKKVTANDEALYNLANTLYKSGRYREAIKNYKTILGDKTGVSEFKVLHNIANCYVGLDKLEQAKYYYEKSLDKKESVESKENLQEVIKVLKRKTILRHKPSHESQKGPSRISLEQKNDAYETTDSKYTVQINRVVYSEEQMWMKRLENRESPSFLQKIPTTKRSLNVLQD